MMRASRVIVACAVLAALVVGCRSRSNPKSTGTAADRPVPTSPPAVPTQAPQPAVAGGEILFLSDRSGELALYRMRPDGSEVAQVAAPDGVTVFPAAGRVPVAIATSGGEDEHREQLAVTGEEGWQLVGPAAGKIRNPSAAPDGSWIAFESDRESFRDIYRVDVATGEVTRLTDDGSAFEPAVAPDGRRIAFVSTASGDPQVHLMDPDGKARERLVDLGVEHSPAWSPDGARIAVASGAHGPERIFLVPAGGGEARRLTERDESDLHEVAPRFSPNGDRVLYELHAADGSRELWVTAVDGANSVRLSPSGAHVDQPSWSPDGRHVVWSDDGEIYAAPADGSGVRQVTRDPANDWLPRWR